MNGPPRLALRAIFCHLVANWGGALAGKKQPVRVFSVRARAEAEAEAGTGAVRAAGA